MLRSRKAGCSVLRGEPGKTAWAWHAPRPFSAVAQQVDDAWDAQPTEPADSEPVAGGVTPAADSAPFQRPVSDSQPSRYLTDFDAACAEHFATVQQHYPALAGVWRYEEFRALMHQQLLHEDEARDQAWDDWLKELESAQRNQLVTRMPVTKQLISGWLPGVAAAIKREQEQIMAGEETRSRNQYGSYLLLLPPEELALITIHCAIDRCMLKVSKTSSLYPAGSAVMLELALHLGAAVNDRIKLLKLRSTLQEGRKSAQQAHELFDTAPEQQRAAFKEKLQRAMMDLRRLEGLQKQINQGGNSASKFRLKRAFEEEDWGQETHAQLGSILIKLLADTAKIDHYGGAKAAFEHHIVWQKKLGQKKKLGLLQLHEQVRKKIKDSASLQRLTIAKAPPMVVPPPPWSHHAGGGGLTTHSPMVRTRVSQGLGPLLQEQHDKGKLKEVYAALTALGGTAWRINTDVLQVVTELWDTGSGGVAGLPPKYPLRLPNRPSATFRLVRLRGQLLVSGSPPTPAELQPFMAARADVAKLNREAHSLRMDFLAKLGIARECAAARRLFYPHNLDFRGRAYPLHPHLQHLGDDLTRSLLRFGDGQQLGPHGLDWLFVHLANLYGHGRDKGSFRDRIAFVDSQLPLVLDSAGQPLGGYAWWLEAESPWQALACCMEIRNALATGDPETYISSLPVHMDGSCNGLQHYAALGRDAEGGAAVNLLPSREPQDVYSAVVKIVQRRVEEDAATGIGEALKIREGIDRKLIKQTVMTSVYGVTMLGARDQICARLKERGYEPHTANRLARYMAAVTLASIGEMFANAKNIMSWLTQCARLIAAQNQPVVWHTPLGLPALQPYTALQGRPVKTIMQSFWMRNPEGEGDTRQNKSRQRSAFPPNYIHCLDSSHMMMTANACAAAGITFAGVHDSFWTHAGSVDVLNGLLRQKFVELHSRPLLENLLREFQGRYPDINFPPIPKRGGLQLKRVERSAYFFN